ncbi:uncharacterized protein K452DRAFT_305822 [Aplosporella prunicola CBS 121167]|uniref:Uncharacterized protein n=1 Tax=Aplosporella prunicola CBS 121167 TaxID=1176127 RepID=A0A6A6BLD5_9PEZI|nr:uncharacterized protein K452DRAFT_305822 [Aplosporella prunicola CBS 121167]KAF2144856.1 hypothetical protein K452DRAFT_305822 [Aplosporella prunicola CBS 121167]
MFKSFWIRYHLSRSVPWEFRPFYSLIADPAAGTVTVVARTPRLKCPWLWKDKIGHEQTPSTEWRLKRWRHRTFYSSIKCFRSLYWLLPVTIFRLFKKLGQRSHSKKDSTGIDPITVPSRAFQMELSGNSNWSTYNLALESRNKAEKIKTEFHVGQPTLLHSVWMTASLRCGFSMCSEDDESARNLEYRLQEETRFVVDGDLSIGKPTPLAMDWAQFVLFVRGIGIHPFHVDPDLKDYKLVAMDGNTVLRVSEVNHRWFAELQPNHNHQRSVRRALAWDHIMVLDRNKSFFCWALGKNYTVPLHTLNIGSGLSSAVSPICLINNNYTTDLTKDSISSSRCDMSGRDPQDCPDQLAAALTWLFYEQGCQRRGEILPISQRFLEVRERSLCLLKRLDRETVPEQRMHSILATHIEREKLSAVQATALKNSKISKLSDKVLSSLRKAFDNSEYVVGTCKLYESLPKLYGPIRFSLWGGEYFSLLAEEVGELLETTQRPLKDAFQNRRTATIDNPELESSENLRRLKSLFDPFEAEIPKREVQLADESDDMTLLAHILLGLADWEGCRRQRWMLTDEMSSITQILNNKASERSDKEIGYVYEIATEDFDKLKRHAEHGIYASPPLPKRNTLLQRERNMYLL